MGFKYEHSSAGLTPLTKVFPATGAATLKDAAIGLTAGATVIGTATGVAVVGVALSSPVAAAEGVPCILATGDVEFKVGKSGAATPVLGGKYDTSADGLTINADDVTDPKWKVVEKFADSEYGVVNISFAL